MGGAFICSRSACIACRGSQRSLGRQRVGVWARVQARSLRTSNWLTVSPAVSIRAASSSAMLSSSADAIVAQCTALLLRSEAVRGGNGSERAIDENFPLALTRSCPCLTLPFVVGVRVEKSTSSRLARSPAVMEALSWCQRSRRAWGALSPAISGTMHSNRL